MPALARPVRDIIAHRLGASRGSQWGLHLHWSTSLSLKDAVSADSIDLVDAADGVLRLFRIDQLGWEDALLMHPSIGGWAALAEASLSEQGSLLFSSSGTQGTPKGCLHSLGALWREAQHLATMVGPRARLLCAVPTHHIYGFIFGVLLPDRLGCEVVDVCGLPATMIARKLQAGDVLVAHPLMWSKLEQAVERWPAGVVATSSTAPVDEELVLRLRSAGLSRWVEVYGSSETAGIGWREDPCAPFQLFPWWRGADEDALLAEDGSSVALPDCVAVQGRSLRPVSRHDLAVQVAGVNVYPERVARTLELMPEVASARVRLDVRSGRLMAWVAPAATAALSEAQLRRWCQDRLSSPECPSAYTIATESRSDVTSKPVDW